MNILSLFILIQIFLGLFCGEIVIESAARTVYLQTHVVRIHQRMKIKNEMKEHVDSIMLAYPSSKIDKIGLIVASEAGETDTLSVTEFRPANEEFSVCDVVLSKPLESGETITVDIMETLMKYLTPLPRKIRQNENQKLLFEDNMYLISPYVVEYQSSQLRLPSPTVEKYTQDLTASLENAVLSYGPFSRQEPFTKEDLMVHFTYNNPYLHINSLLREVEISHWGNLAIEEHYVISHAGAELKQGFSRIDFQRMGAPSHFRAVRAHLPITARDIYFRDRIGNISTSECKVSDDGDRLFVDFSQRFPLFGGWKTTFYIGYNLPLKDYLTISSSTGVFKLNTTFGSPFPEAPIDDMTLKVIIPEGSASERIELPFEDFDYSEENRKTYLDTFGRKVLVVKKKNVVPEQNREFQVYYDFSSSFFLFEPFLVVVGLFTICVMMMVYVRLDFTISKSGEEVAGEKLKVIDDWCTEYVLMNYDREEIFDLLEDSSMEEDEDLEIIKEEFDGKFDEVKKNVIPSVVQNLKTGKAVKEAELIEKIEGMTAERFEKQLEIIQLEKEAEGEEQRKGFYDKRNRLQDEYDDLKDNILDTLELLK